MNISPFISRLAAVLLLLASVARAEEGFRYQPPPPVPGSCEAYLQDIARTLGAAETASAQATVQLLRDFEGRWGRVLLLERADGQPWRSSAGGSVTPQGNPRQFIDSIGADVAGFFAFHRIGDRRMTAGNHAELNGALDRLNGWLPADEGVPTRFYVPRTEAGSARAYVRRYGENGELPIAPEGITQIHDISAHVGTLFVPLPLLRHGQAQARAVSRFERFVRETMTDFAETEDGRELLRRLILTEIQHIDGGTAIAAGAFAPLPSRAATALAYEILGNQGHSPREHLEMLLSGWQSYGTFGMTDTPLTAAQMAALPTLLRARDRFVARERAADPTFERRLQVGGRDFIVGTGTDSRAWLRQHDLLCEAFRQRRDQIRNAILANGGGNLPVPQAALDP